MAEHRIGHWIGGDRIHYNCVDCPFEWSEMMALIYYNWNTCKMDGLMCVRGSKPECPKNDEGMQEYCQHFHIEKRKEDVER